jgi:hypothetical protein
LESHDEGRSAEPEPEFGANGFQFWAESHLRLLQLTAKCCLNVLHAWCFSLVVATLRAALMEAAWQKCIILLVTFSALLSMAALPHRCKE